VSAGGTDIRAHSQRVFAWTCRGPAEKQVAIRNRKVPEAKRVADRAGAEGAPAAEAHSLSQVWQRNHQEVSPLGTTDRNRPRRPKPNLRRGVEHDAAMREARRVSRPRAGQGRVHETESEIAEGVRHGFSRRSRRTGADEAGTVGAMRSSLGFFFAVLAAVGCSLVPSPPSSTPKHDAAAPDPIVCCRTLPDAGPEGCLCEPESTDTIMVSGTVCSASTTLNGQAIDFTGTVVSTCP